MQVVLLCGGQGTRLREETEYRPKPLIDIGGKPILWHIMKLCAHSGFLEFVLCLGYRGNMLKEYFLNYEAMNSDFNISLGSKSRVDYLGAHDEQNYQVKLVDTGLETLTGGRVKRVEKYINGDTFLVSYGDSLANVDLKKLVNFHRSHGKLATVTAVKPISRFGVLDIHSSGKVQHFAEKPTIDGWVSAGFFIFEKPFFKYLTGDESVLEREPLERLAREGQLMAYQHEGFFFAMDTYREYLYLNELWQSGKAPWKVWK